MKRRRYSSRRRRPPRRFGGAPSPVRLHKEMNASSKRARAKEIEAASQHPNLVAVSLPFVRGQAETDYHTLLKTKLSAGKHYPSLGHVPLREGRVVFVVFYRYVRKELVWYKPQGRVRSVVVGSKLQWRRAFKNIE